MPNRGNHKENIVKEASSGYGMSAVEPEDFDLSLLKDSLAKTPWERMQANDDALNFGESAQSCRAKPYKASELPIHFPRKKRCHQAKARVSPLFHVYSVQPADAPGDSRWPPSRIGLLRPPVLFPARECRVGHCTCRNTCE